MKCGHDEAIRRLRRKAATSHCRYLIAALGIDYRGRFIGIKTNTARYMKKGGGMHAEMALMRSQPKSLSTILLIRVNRSGHILPIAPCVACATKATDLGISIRTVS